MTRPNHPLFLADNPSTRERAGKEEGGILWGKGCRPAAARQGGSAGCEAEADVRAL
jgi:hypothetical protein